MIGHQAPNIEDKENVCPDDNMDWLHTNHDCVRRRQQTYDNFCVPNNLSGHTLLNATATTLGKLLQKRRDYEEYLEAPHVLEIADLVDDGETRQYAGEGDAKDMALRGWRMYGGARLGENGFQAMPCDVSIFFVHTKHIVNNYIRLSKVDICHVGPGL